MRVALDAQLTVGTATGIGEYVRGLLEAFAGRRRLVRAARAGPRPVALRPALDLGPVHFYHGATRVGGAALTLHRRHHPGRAGVPTVVTVHDLAWPTFSPTLRLRALLFRRALAAALPARCALAVDSPFSRERAAAFSRAIYDRVRVEVVYPGVAADFCGSRAESGTAYDPRHRYGRTEKESRNLDPRAWRICPGARLVAIGPRTPYARVRGRASLGVAIESRCPATSNRAEGSPFTNLARRRGPVAYQGFGYAAAQALCAGVPCIVSDRSFAPGDPGGNDAPIVPADDA